MLKSKLLLQFPAFPMQGPRLYISIKVKVEGLFINGCVKSTRLPQSRMAHQTSPSESSKQRGGKGLLERRRRTEDIPLLQVDEGGHPPYTTGSASAELWAGSCLDPKTHSLHAPTGHIERSLGGEVLRGWLVEVLPRLSLQGRFRERKIQEV
jgi:hypothetical protein